MRAQNCLETLERQFLPRDIMMSRRAPWVFVMCDVFARYFFVFFFLHDGQHRHTHTHTSIPLEHRQTIFRGSCVWNNSVWAFFAPLSCFFVVFFVAIVLGKFYEYSPWKSLLILHRPNGCGGFGLQTAAGPHTNPLKPLKSRLWVL